LARLVVVWLVTRAAGMVYIALYPDVAGDVSIYAGWAARLQRGQVPYVDFNLEYPPGVLPLLLLPSPSVVTYRRTFFAVALMLDALVQAFLVRQKRPLGALLWLVAPPALGAVFWSRLDLFVALAFVVAIHALRRGCPVVVAVAIVFAASLKLWPVVLLPLFWWSVSAQGRRRYATASGLTLVAFLAPVLMWSGGPGLGWMLAYHRDRGIAPESLPAVALHIARLAGGGPQIVSGHGAAEFEPGAWLLFTRCVDGLLVVGLLAVLAYAARRGGRTSAARILLLAVTVVLCASKVLSPQYTVWAMAVVAMLADELDRARDDAKPLLLATVALLVTTQYLWPIALPELIDGSAFGLLVGVLHAAALVAFATVAVRCCIERGDARSPGGPSVGAVGEQ
jgi:hypothetical protein